MYNFDKIVSSAVVFDFELYLKQTRFNHRYIEITDVNDVFVITQMEALISVKDIFDVCVLTKNGLFWITVSLEELKLNAHFV